MIIEVKSEEEMKAFGERLAKLLKGGEVIQLIGDVGAGKTTLTKGIAKGLGVTEDVQSPSFTISRVYDGRDNLRLAHYDFYRLSDPGIMSDELQETIQDANTVTIIEWADVVKDVLPANAITISIISPDESTRQLTIEGIEESEILQ